MLARTLIVLTTCGALTLVVLPGANGTTEQDAQTQKGLEVLARGPVHEAYAQPTSGNPQAGAVVPREPPRPIEEQPPDQKPAGSTWVPGYWQWDDERSDFIWISGSWRVPPPGRQWVPGTYRQTDNGFQWSPGVWMPQNQQQLNVVPPPPQSLENGPSQPAPIDNSTYVPGSWMYRDERYLWRPGYWTGYRPDYVWFPPQYYLTPAGYVFVDGYWDYPLLNRGLLFAPVAFNGPVWNQPGFSYTPSLVVSAGFLPTALFVRPAWGHYYFGDYFGGGFARAGYTPWINYAYRPAVYDPLYVHAQLAFGPGWQRNLATLYANRAVGQGVLPPRTLVQQNLVLNRANVANVNHVRVLTPLSQAGNQGFRMTALNQAERFQYQRNGQQLRQLSAQRWNVPHAGPSAPAPANRQIYSPGRAGGFAPQHAPIRSSVHPQGPHGVQAVPHSVPHGAMPAHTVHPSNPGHGSHPTPHHTARLNTGAAAIIQAATDIGDRKVAGTLRVPWRTAHGVCLLLSVPHSKPIALAQRRPEQFLSLGVGPLIQGLLPLCNLDGNGSKQTDGDEHERSGNWLVHGRLGGKSWLQNSAAEAVGVHWRVLVGGVGLARLGRGQRRPAQ